MLTMGSAWVKLYSKLSNESALRAIGHVTSDNAKNNGTMLLEFARLIKLVTKRVWDPVERHIGCLAHVINIATQKLISAYSKSIHFNPYEPTAHIPDTSAASRYARPRKDLFKRIQLRHQASPDEIAKQMVLDMKDVDKFVFQIAMDEVGEKRQKLAALQLSESEWKRVDLFLNLLAVRP
ncbi:hypothetical protein C8J57DRAFT_1240809 [Mycena rebaudengoi]|nr:hypothetical protein C8J57DRAFT_1240809 [Mycena rebaudengoi]